jgi:hypothetical protein
MQHCVALRGSLELPRCLAYEQWIFESGSIVRILIVWNLKLNIPDSGSLRASVGKHSGQAAAGVNSPPALSIQPAVVS